jgi:hypothetical protein
LAGAPASQHGFDGSLATIDKSGIAIHLAAWAETVPAAQPTRAANQEIVMAGDRPNPIRHVLDIIKENRTCDQILGDLA